MTNPPRVRIIQNDRSQSDAQGAISIDITPENLTQFGVKIIFDVSMNTHSVDLSMDLAKLASLERSIGVSRAR